MYVPKTLSEYVNESTSITLKRKYGQRQPIVVGTNAPLRNQVLSYVAENASVSKRNLKQFIIGLKEGGSTVAAANMFIKRNSKYFITENKNGITYFKLSSLGKKLLNQFATPTNSVSESKKANVIKPKSKKLSEKYQSREFEDMPEDVNIEETPGYEEEQSNDMMMKDQYVPISLEDDFEDPEAAEEIEFDDDRFENGIDSIKDDMRFIENDEESDEDEETEEDIDDMEGSSYKAKLEELTDLASELYEQLPEGEIPSWVQDKITKTLQNLEDISSWIHSDEEQEEGAEQGPRRKMDHVDMNMPEENKDEEIEDYNINSRNKIMGKDRLHDFQRNSMKHNQYMSHEDEEFENEEINDQNDESHNEFDNRRYDFKDKGRAGIYDMDENEKTPSRIKEIIERMKQREFPTLNEAEEEKEIKDDELKDEDLDDLNLDDTEETSDDDLNLDAEPEDVEKIEITEFIITVDDADSAIEELQELGVNAERVPIEKETEIELPTELDEPEEESADLDSEEKSNESVNEEENAEELDLGTNDELNLGDQGEKTSELDDTENDELEEPVAEFEENKIKVPAESWPILKTWLEDKGVDVKEMFGGDIEMEEETEETREENSDEDIDFSGIGEEDDTKVKEGK